MTGQVPGDQIEIVVGARRHPREHIIRGIPDDGFAYILHSSECRARYDDLRECPWSLALDRGLVWLPPDQPRYVRLRNSRLIDGGPVNVPIGTEADR